MTSIASSSFSPLQLWHWLRDWRQTRLIDGVDRIAVLEAVFDNGRLGPRYAFMVVMSCGIAMLGLLQNSAAVIIGAMLIAPLMGPIIELGMGLATFDLRSIRSALITLVAGLLLGLAVAMAIVWLSPLQQATPEILARTQPTLFDLLVAVLSGLAGGYATVSRKGETIVGVAIATALMPPLAVAGYGMALGNWNVAGGAWMLLLTNTLAIALSVTVVARLYGFGGRDTPKQTALQATLIVLTFVLLAIPLGLSLKRIALQAQVEVAVRQELNRAAATVGGRISALTVEGNDRGVVVDAVLMTPQHVGNAEQERLAERLRRSLDRPVQLRLAEVLTADDAAIARQATTLSELRRSVEALQTASADQRAGQAAAAQARMALQSTLVDAIGELRTVGDGWEFRLQSRSAWTLAQARALEQRVQAAHPDSRFRLIPSIQALPWIVFDDDSSTLPASDDWNAAVWALQRWQVDRVTVEGHGGTPALARARAEQVADALRAQRIAVDAVRTADTAQTRGLIRVSGRDEAVRSVRILLQPDEKPLFRTSWCWGIP